MGCGAPCATGKNKSRSLNVDTYVELGVVSNGIYGPGWGSKK